jgi:hypothetical protein
MSIQMHCPTCGAANTFDEGQEGKTVRCSKCEERFTAKPPRPSSGPPSRFGAASNSAKTPRDFSRKGEDWPPRQASVH